MTFLPVGPRELATRPRQLEEPAFAVGQITRLMFELSGIVTIESSAERHERRSPTAFIRFLAGRSRNHGAKHLKRHSWTGIIWGRAANITLREIILVYQGHSCALAAAADPRAIDRPSIIKKVPIHILS